MRGLRSTLIPLVLAGLTVTSWLSSVALEATRSDAAERVMLAIACGSFAKVKWMIRLRPSLIQSNGADFLHQAAMSGHLNIVKYFLNKGIPIGACTKCGHTALHGAAIDGRVAVVDFLLDRGADVNALSQFGTSPLHYAIMSGNVECVRRLVRAGADIMLRKVNGDVPSPLVYAASNQKWDMVACMVTNSSRKVSQDVLNEWLANAIIMDDEKGVRVLLSCGADPHSKRVNVVLNRYAVTGGCQRFLPTHDREASETTCEGEHLK